MTNFRRILRFLARSGAPLLASVAAGTVLAQNGVDKPGLSLGNPNNWRQIDEGGFCRILVNDIDPKFAGQVLKVLKSDVPIDPDYYNAVMVAVTKYLKFKGLDVAPCEISQGGILQPRIYGPDHVDAPNRAQYNDAIDRLERALRLQCGQEMTLRTPDSHGAICITGDDGKTNFKRPTKDRTVLIDPVQLYPAGSGKQMMADNINPELSDFVEYELKKVDAEKAAKLKKKCNPGAPPHGKKLYSGGYGVLESAANIGWTVGQYQSHLEQTGAGERPFMPRYRAIFWTIGDWGQSAIDGTLALGGTVSVTAAETILFWEDDPTGCHEMSLYATDWNEVFKPSQLEECLMGISKPGPIDRSKVD